jgi:hypothetical protein
MYVVAGAEVLIDLWKRRARERKSLYQVCAYLIRAVTNQFKPEAGWHVAGHWTLD